VDAECIAWKVFPKTHLVRVARAFTIAGQKGLANDEGLSGKAPRIRNGPLDMRLAVGAFCCEAIVSPAQQPKIFRLGAAPAPFRSFMIELQKGMGIAAPPVLRHERTPPSVALHDLTTGGMGHVRVLRGPRLFQRPTGSALFLLLKLGDEQIHSALQYDCEVAFWIRVAHQVGSEIELLSHGAARGEFN
jgi:hypothetical protein